MARARKKCLDKTKEMLKTNIVRRHNCLRADARASFSFNFNLISTIVDFYHQHFCSTSHCDMRSIDNTKDFFLLCACGLVDDKHANCTRKSYKQQRLLFIGTDIYLPLPLFEFRVKNEDNEQSLWLWQQWMDKKSTILRCLNANSIQGQCKAIFKCVFNP